jgi:hypothetical protein
MIRPRDRHALRHGCFLLHALTTSLFEIATVSHRPDTGEAKDVSAHMPGVARRRSLVVLATFTIGMLVAFIAPRLSFGLICVAPIHHLRPDVSGSIAGWMGRSLGKASGA